jgi:hypothetical protein
MSQVAPSIRVNPFTINHSKPMHTLAIDTIGPLPEDEKGNKYIIAIIDTFSRFLELYPVVDTTSGVAASSMLVGTEPHPSLFQMEDRNMQMQLSKTLHSYLVFITISH